MSRSGGLIIFLTIVLTILIGLHAYLWIRLIRDPQWGAPWNAVATVLLVIAAASIPTVFVLRRTSPHVLSMLVWPAFIWLGLMFLLVVTLAGTDLLRLLMAIARRAAGEEAPSPERRAFFARWLAGGALATTAAMGALAVRSALTPVAVRRVEVPLRRLRPSQDGITLVQLTDLHIGPTIGREVVADVVRRTNELRGDVVVITGDLVDGSVDELRDAVAPLGGLRAKHGVFFVTGNHEYFSGASAWLRALVALGIRPLRNERVTIGTGEQAFDLAGVDDRSAARFTQGNDADDDGRGDSINSPHGEDLNKALAGRDPNRAVVLLAHQPRTVLDAARFGVDLQLSGHTHGGQIWPFGALVRLQQRFLAGLGRQGDTMIYVSRGTGYWGPPMRLFAPAEITQLVLKAIV